MITFEVQTRWALRVEKESTDPHLHTILLYPPLFPAPPPPPDASNCAHQDASAQLAHSLPIGDANPTTPCWVSQNSGKRGRVHAACSARYKNNNTSRVELCTLVNPSWWFLQTVIPNQRATTRRPLFPTAFQKPPLTSSDLPSQLDQSKWTVSSSFTGR